jgi:hypothetical protein
MSCGYYLVPKEMKGSITAVFFNLFPVSGRTNNSSQVRAAAITYATGNCTFGAIPPLQFNNIFFYLIN